MKRLKLFITCAGSKGSFPRSSRAMRSPMLRKWRRACARTRPCSSTSPDAATRTCIPSPKSQDLSSSEARGVRREAQTQSHREQFRLIPHAFHKGFLMSRIAATFAALERQNRKGLILFVTAGDPDPVMTVPLMHALVNAGADVIELGVPFSDPMADGPTI